MDSTKAAYISTKQTILFIGAGPVGLFTAIQLKLRLNSEYFKIKFLEKYKTYQRSQTLILDPSSFDDIDIEDEDLQDFVEMMKRIPKIKINDLETQLMQHALNLGIEIINDTFTSISGTLLKYPDTKIIVGTDGAHSVVRKEMSKDELVRSTLQYVFMMKYKAAVNGPLDSLSLYTLSKKAPAHLIFENVSTNQSGFKQVTLQIFITQEIFDEMRPKVSKTYTIEELKQDCQIIHDLVITYLHMRPLSEGPTEYPSYSIFALDCYYARYSFSFVQNTLTLLCGDALMGVPYLRSINNGFLMATKLSKQLSFHLNTQETLVHLNLQNIICHVLVYYFKHHHAPHGAIHRIEHHSHPTPHINIQTHVIWNKNWTIYFDFDNEEMVEIVNSEYMEIPYITENHDHELINPNLSIKKQVIDQNYLNRLEKFMIRLPHSFINEYQNYHQHRVMIEGLTAQIRNAGVQKARSVVKFNTYLPWEFVGIVENQETRRAEVQFSPHVKKQMDYFNTHKKGTI